MLNRYSLTALWMRTAALILLHSARARCILTWHWMQTAAHDSCHSKMADWTANLRKLLWMTTAALSISSLLRW